MRLWGAQKVQECDLINGCISGNRKMQEQLYKIFSPAMFSICLRYGGNYEQAEDMMQEGFIRVFRNLSKFRNEGSFEGWMKRIFINVGIEGYRKNIVVNHTTDVEFYQNDLVQEDDLHRLSEAELLRMIQSLSPGYRTIFNLYAIEGYSHQECPSDPQ